LKVVILVIVSAAIVLGLLGFGAEQIEKHKDELKLIEWPDPADTTAEALLDTAAMMKCLDLVIAIDTSVPHLAGALSVPVWVAMPLASDWRWLLDREDTPWYPTMRLFRQSGNLATGMK
jgi:ADP-heptose:LPS heptosyltransferase